MNDEPKAITIHRPIEILVYDRFGAVIAARNVASFSSLNQMAEWYASFINRDRFGFQIDPTYKES